MIHLMLWLMPPPQLEAALKAAHDHANSTLAGLKFPMHATVAGGFECDLEVFEGHCRDVLADVPPIAVELNGIELGKTFHQSLFVAASVSAALVDVRRRLYDRFPETAGAFDPHFSLYYGLADRDQKLSAMKALPAFKGGYECTRFAIGARNDETGDIYTQRMIAL